MKRGLKPGLLLLLPVVTLFFACSKPDYETAQVYPGPARFATTIRAFEEQDRLQPPPAGAIVFTGSSSFRMWHGTIAEDLAPLTIIPRGFGGSTMYDVLHYVHRLVLSYKPRAVVLYAGDNDVTLGVSPAIINATFNRLVAAIHSKLPQTRIYMVSIKPSIARWEMWPQMQTANDLLRQTCETDARLTFIDISAQMLGADGQPRRELFVDDLLHMNAAGYALWTEVIRPVLLAGRANANSPIQPE